MATISTRLNSEDLLKLLHRAARASMSPEQALRVIAVKGVPFFNALLVGATEAKKK